MTMKHIQMVGDKKAKRQSPKYLCAYGHRHDTRAEAASCTREYLQDKPSH
jgi:hypothetical protein